MKGLGYHLDKKEEMKAEPDKESVEVSKELDSFSGSNQAAYYAPFSYDFRQLAHCISIVVNVSHIDSATVDMKYDKNIVTVRFTAMESKESSVGIHYGMIFECPGEVSPEKSTFSAASNNMALVLVKSVPGMWLFKSAVVASGGVTVADTAILKEKQILENSILTVKLLPVKSAAGNEQTNNSSSNAEVIDPLVKLASPPVTINGNPEVLKYVENQYNQLTFSNSQVLYELD